jgi:hypothetical protein
MLNSLINIQGILNSINAKVPYRLQDKALFTLIGRCAVPETTFASDKELNGDFKEGFSEFQRGILMNCGIWVDILLSESKSASFGKEGMTTIPVVHNLLIGSILFENCDCHVCKL